VFGAQEAAQRGHGGRPGAAARGGPHQLTLMRRRKRWPSMPGGSALGAPAPGGGASTPAT